MLHPSANHIDDRPACWLSCWDSSLCRCPKYEPVLDGPVLLSTLKLLLCAMQVALHIPGAYNLTVHLPIMIGTVPYRRAQSYCFTQSRFYRETQAQFADMDFLPLPPPYRETITPPPPFEGKCRLYVICTCILYTWLTLVRNLGCCWQRNENTTQLHASLMCMQYAWFNRRFSFDLHETQRNVCNNADEAFIAKTIMFAFPLRLWEWDLANFARWLSLLGFACLSYSFVVIRNDGLTYPYWAAYTSFSDPNPITFVNVRKIKVGSFFLLSFKESVDFLRPLIILGLRIGSSLEGRFFVVWLFSPASFFFPPFFLLLKLVLYSSCSPFFMQFFYAAFLCSLF